jgi:hypothetical protein
LVDELNDSFIQSETFCENISGKVNPELIAMNLTILDPAKLQTSPIVSISEKSKKPQPRAQWLVIDGKPTCRWIVD